MTQCEKNVRSFLALSSAFLAELLAAWRIFKGSLEQAAAAHCDEPTTNARHGFSIPLSRQKKPRSQNARCAHTLRRVLEKFAARSAIASKVGVVGDGGLTGA